MESQNVDTGLELEDIIRQQHCPLLPLRHHTHYNLIPK